jgi:hypothetical protein
MAQPKSTRRHKAAAKRIPRGPRLGKSPAQFCEAYGISRSTFEEWRRRGLGPAELQPIPGGRIIISEQAEREWLAKRIAPAAVAE